MFGQCGKGLMHRAGGRHASLKDAADSAVRRAECSRRAA
jgi:hypothetical protein